MSEERLYAVWYDNGTGYLELAGTINALNGNEAIKKALTAYSISWSYKIVATLPQIDHNPNSTNNGDYILAEWVK